MRAPYQILAIPYRATNDSFEYCVLHRSDCDQWQFIAGGGEDDETPIEAAKREAMEEGGIASDDWTSLKSLAYIPVSVISEDRRRHWDNNIYIIPEYAFGFACDSDVELSDEHNERVWLPYNEAYKKLKWDSNRTALYELNCRLMSAKKV